MRRRQFLGAMAGAAAVGVPTASAQAAGYGPLGLAEVRGAAEAVMGDDGETAYLAATTGFATVDVSDPADPTVLAERRDILAEREDGPMRGIIDVKVDGDRLVVPGPGNPTGSEVATGFALYDVSDPAAPERLAFQETPAPVHNAHLDGGRVYLTQGGVVSILDVADDDPTNVGEIDITDFERRWSEVRFSLRLPHDVWVQDEVAYVPTWEAGTWVVDVSDPGSPELLTHIEARPYEAVASVPIDAASREGTEPPGNHHYAQPTADGRILAIGMESWDAEAGDGEGGASGIELWDVSEPGSPVKLSAIHPPRAEDETRRGTWTTSHNFDVAGDRLYSSWYQGGVKVHDISDPGSPEELAWWREPERAAFWAAVRATPDVFVASATGIGGRPDLAEGLFTFPTEPGEQSSPPSTPAASRPSSSFATARPTPTPSPTAPPTTESSGQPGFGLLSGLAGAGAGLWWLAKRADGED